MDRKTRYATSGELSIAYQVIGEGPRDLVFVAGFVGHLEVMWEWPANARLFERLASFSRLIVFDRRGQGLSDRPPEPATLEQTMDDIRAVMDAAGSERAALFAISEGGAASALFAATHPDRVTALALWGSYPRVIEEPGFASGITKESLGAFLGMMTERWGDPDVSRHWAPSLAGDADFQRFWTRMFQLGTSPGGARALIGLYEEIDVRDVLPAIQAPTVVIHATRDRIVPIVCARALAEGIPGARMVEVDGDDHLPALCADAVVGEIEELLTGRRHVPEPERVLATVLFTDIVDSTRRAAELGDSTWRDLVGRHDDLVRRQVDLARGRVVKQLGDGVLATFDGPGRAIGAAKAIVEGMRDIGLEVRAGLHTGELELIGDDVAGMAVNIGARVSALAGPGEVLTSSTVRDLVFGSGFAFDERGSHTLKGVPGEWRLFAVA